MDYSFDELTERRGTNSYKWDKPEDADVIPMWVADMDFRVAPAISAALAKRVSHGIFGYTLVPDAYYDAITRWFKHRHDWEIDKDWIIYTSGVVPAVSAIIKALTVEGDKVIVQTPVYNCFFSSIKNNGCEVLENPLTYNDGIYTMDFDDLERKAADSKAKLMLLCNPHNPTGRVWTREELLHLNDICMRNGVMVLADEIHCELVYGNHRYVPFATVSKECMDNSIVCNSPSKAFNIAGLQIANIISNNPAIRRRIDRAININEVCDVNPFGVDALMAAYNYSEDWLDELCRYIKGNYDALCNYIASMLPILRVTPLEGTYLVWIDCTSLNTTSNELTGLLLNEAKVMVNSGTMYGTAGEGFIRINIACPRSRMMEALQRIAGVVIK